MNLDGNNIGDSGIKYLSNSLEKNNTITKLDLNDNNISSENLNKIKSILSKNSREKKREIQGQEGNKLILSKFLEGFNFYICFLTQNIKLPFPADLAVYEED